MSGDEIGAGGLAAGRLLPAPGGKRRVTRRMHGIGVATAGSAAAIVLLAGQGPAMAKVPGQVHCYGKVCHRVLSVTEVGRLVGRAFDTHTSYYDIPERDRFNTGTITSSGERFDAWSPHRAASSIYPDGTELLIWNPRNGRAAHVRVNDFGPFYAQRTLDVTRRVAQDLGFEKSGVAVLKVVVVAAPSPEEARHRKGRSYTRAYGYVGTFTPDDLEDLSSDLIADAIDDRSAPKVAAATPAASASAGEPRSRLGWAQRVALARAESGISATSELVLALAIDAAGRLQTPLIAVAAATPALDSPAPAATAPETMQANAAPPRALAAMTEPPPVVAADPRPAEAVASAPITTVAQATSIDLSTASEPVPPAAVALADATGKTEPTAALGSAPAEPATQTTLVAGAAETNDGTTTLRRRAPRPAPAPYGLAAPDMMPWMLAALLGATLLLLGRVTRDRRTADVVARAAAPAAAAPTDEPIAAVTADVAPLAFAPAIIVAPAAPTTDPLSDLADLSSHARDLLADGRPHEAEAVFRLAVAGYEQAVGPTSETLAGPLCALGEAIAEQGRHSEARVVLARALALASAPGASPRAIADILEARALLSIRADDPASAIDDARRAVALREANAPRPDPDLGVALSILGEAHRVSGDLHGAEAAHRHALARFATEAGHTGLRTAGSMTSLAEVLATLGRTTEARSLLMTALPILERHLGLRHPGVARSRVTLANVHQAHGDIDAAVRLRRQSLAILEDVQGAEHPEVVAARSHLASIIVEPLARAG